MKLAVGVCHNRDHSPKFTFCLVTLMMRLASQGVCGKRLEALGYRPKFNASLLPKGREQILATALVEGFTHLLMLDDDMLFPPDVVDDLARHGERIVMANCVRKNRRKVIPTAVSLDEKLVDSRGKTGLEEIGRCGFAVALLDLEAVRYLAPPHFEIRWSERLGDYLGEDYEFCRLLREAGERLYVDHDASLKIRHLGDFDYGFDMTEEDT